MRGRSSRQERTKEELARAARAHSGVVSALEVALSAEKSHCKDVRTRFERQVRQHEANLGEAEQRLLNTQQELDKVRANGRGAKGQEVSPLQECPCMLCVRHFSTALSARVRGSQTVYKEGVAVLVVAVVIVVADVAEFCAYITPHSRRCGRTAEEYPRPSLSSTPLKTASRANHPLMTASRPSRP